MLKKDNKAYSSEKVQQALFRIAQVSAQTSELDDLYTVIQSELNKLIDTTNFFIGFYNKESDTLSLPFMVDEHDDYQNVDASGTISGWVIKNKKPLLLSGKEEEKFIRQYLKKQVGTSAKCWLGVPLHIGDEAVGIIVIQSYTNENAYNQKDMELFKFIAETGSSFITKKRAETEIRKLSRALEQSPNVVVITDPNGQITYVNPAFEKSTGYTKKEALGNNPNILKSGQQPKKFYSELWQTIQAGKTWKGEFSNKKKDGTLYWEEATIGPIKDENDQIIHFIAIKSDITSRKRTEKELADKKYLLDTLMNNMTDNIFFKDLEGRYIQVNKAYANQINIKKEDNAFNKTDFDFFNEEYASSGKNIEKLVIQNRKAIQLDENIVWPSGQNSWVSTVKVPMINDNDNVVGTIGISRDISDIKIAEEELVTVHQETDQILRSIESILIVMDEHEKIFRFNGFAEKILGVKEYKAIGKTILESGINWDWPRVVEAIEQCRTTKKTITVHDVSFEDANKKQGFLNLSISPFLTSNMPFPGFLILGIDNTERSLLENQLGQAQKLESIGQLAAGIAHEINTPTQFVGDNTQFLKDAFDDLKSLITRLVAVKEKIISKEDVERQIEEIDQLVEDIDLEYLLEEIPTAVEQSLEGISRVSKIVRAMKEFSHPGVREKVAINLNQAIRNTITVSRNEWKYVADLEEDFDDKLPEVACIPDEFNQVILNLITNGAHAVADKLKVTKEEKGLLKISTKYLGESVEIRVTDSGSGIPDEIKDRVFDPFFTTKEVGKGTGQGLAISHNVITQKHNGSINFESEKDKGTTFVIRLPFN